MSSDVFTLKVLTPAGLVLEDTVTSVTLPAQNGEIGVLPAHAKYTGLLGIGVLQYFPVSGGGAKKLVISEGFGTFNDNTLVILTDFVALPEAVDSKTYAKDREALQKVVDLGSLGDPSYAVARGKLGRIEAIDRLIGVH